MSEVKCQLIHDHFQNAKTYNIPRAQLVIADIPYNIGTNFYASRPDWYVDGDNSNGESSKAHKAAFNTDFTFNIPDFFAFGNRLLKKEPSKGEKDAPCMVDAGIPCEDARYITPQAVPTTLYLTMNARELLHFFSLRTCNRAQWEIRHLADEMLKLCRESAPIIFADAGPGCVSGLCPEKKPCGHPRNKNDWE